MNLDGEQIDMAERVVVSPAAGVFVAAAPLPQRLEAGTPIGTIEGGGSPVPVVSPFSGRLGAMVATSGQRLRPYQRVAWLIAG